jgi:hypothetical protein
MNNNNKTAIALLAVGLVVAAVSSLTPSQVSAQEAKLMYACYMQGSGVVYRINPPDDPGQDPKLKDDCTGKKHVKFYWVEFVGADGKVGIGVPEPEAELDVAGDIHASGQLRLGENTVTIDPVANTITTGTDEDLAILPGGTGKVGIGTDAPDEMLTVAGTIESTDGGFKFPDGTVQATAASGGGTADHGSLTGLDDDDHLQYLLADGVRNTTNGFAVTGEYGTGTIPVSGPGTRMMWYPGKAAFRVGQVDDTNWDESNIGRWSTAMGENTRARGRSSVAMGRGAEAIDDASTAMGTNTRAVGRSSTAMGYHTLANGNVSTAMGTRTVAHAFASVVLGRWNARVGDETEWAWVDTDPILVVGNGSSEAELSNAFILLKNGNLAIAGAFTANGTIESTTGGIRFPDGSVQTTAAANGTGLTLVLTERRESVEVPNLGARVKTVACLAGEVLSGGGFKTIGAGKRNARIIDSGPAEDGLTWLAQAVHDGITSDPYTLQVFAQCLKLQ